jgi:hypothetical protein
MLTEFKRQADLLDSMSEISSIIRAWNWTTRTHPFLWEVINYLDFNPACSAYTLTLRILFDQGEEGMDMDGNKLKKITQRVRRYLQALHYCGILTAITLDPVDVGPSRWAPTIYLTPWAKDNDFNKVKEFYLTMGGTRGSKPKKVNKDLKELSSHNQKVKALHALNQFKTGQKFSEYYKCPKNHSEGLLKRRKPAPRTKEALKIHKCQVCEKKLIKISYDEFILLKEKELLEYYGV